MFLREAFGHFHDKLKKYYNFVCCGVGGVIIFRQFAVGVNDAFHFFWSRSKIYGQPYLFQLKATLIY